MMSATAELRRDILSLQGDYDHLTRLVEAKQEELDLINTDIGRETAKLSKIRAEIARIKSHFGVST
jgi:hypothetical protein